MPSDAEECREPSGKCQAFVREFNVVWRVASLLTAIAKFLVHIVA